MSEDDACVAALEAACSAARDRIAFVAQEKGELEHTNATLHSSLESTKMELEEACTEAAELREALRQVKSERDMAHEEVETVRTRLDQRERALVHATDAAAAAMRAQQEAAERSEELEARVGRRDEALAKAAAEERKNMGAMMSLRDEARGLREERDAAQQEAHRAHAACSSLRTKLAERDARLADVMRRAARDAPAPLGDASNTIAERGRTAASPAAASPAAACAPADADDAAVAAVRFSRRVLDATRADASGGALEEVATRLLRVGLSYTCDRVGGSHDRGVDIRMRSSEDVSAVAQCKSRRVGGQDVSFGEMSAFIGAMALAETSCGFFVTNASFTAAARRAALDWVAVEPARRNLHLFSHEELTALLTKYHDALGADHYIASLLERPPATAAQAAHVQSRRRRLPHSSEAAQQTAAAAVLQRAARRRSSFALVDARIAAAGAPERESAHGSPPQTPPQVIGVQSCDTPNASAASPVDDIPIANGSRPTPTHVRRKWSCQEEQLLCKLWLTLGFGAKMEAGARLPWKEMLDFANSSEPGVFDPCREPGHLKDKARNLGLLVLLAPDVSPMRRAAAEH